MDKPSVLICDDNIAVFKSLESYLTEDGIEAIPAQNGAQALNILHSRHIDLLVLDIMLPDTNGIELCREVRRFSSLPILMLSAKGEELDRIIGLEMGADDYITKPFSPREVTIRIKKALKRLFSVTEKKKLVLNELTVYPESYEVYVNGEKLDLTPKEVELLAYLMYNAGKVLSRELLLNAVWGYEYTGGTRTVDTQIKRIRQKLPEQGVHFTLRSIYGIGYKLEATQ